MGCRTATADAVARDLGAGGSPLPLRSEFGAFDGSITSTGSRCPAAPTPEGVRSSGARPWLRDQRPASPLRCAGLGVRADPTRRDHVDARFRPSRPQPRSIERGHPGSRQVLRRWMLRVRDVLDRIGRSDRSSYPQRPRSTSSRGKLRGLGARLPDPAGHRSSVAPRLERPQGRTGQRWQGQKQVERPPLTMRRMVALPQVRQRCRRGRRTRWSSWKEPLSPTSTYCVSLRVLLPASMASAEDAEDALVEAGDLLAVRVFDGAMG